ncbi:MAG: DegT/DnrJ/EryC1/StrS family aminotransferase [Nakamurella sp.]
MRRSHSSSRSVEAIKKTMSRIFLSKADVTDVEEQYVLAALRSGWIAPLGPEVDAFEREIAERVGVAHALAVSSGTAALHLALLAMGARAGRTVIIPSMTFAASANAAAYTGADVVFVDASADDGNVDPQLLIEAVDTLRAEGADIAAVMSVDLFGRCADYASFAQALADRGVPLVEDAAEALGARYDGKPAGSWGIAAGLSFNGNKIMTTSGGGMLVSDDDELIGRCRYLSTQARQPVPYYQHTDIGYNYRLSNILAALGRAQLSRLDDMIARRSSHREKYRAALASVPGVGFLGSVAQPGDSTENCWLTCITLDPSATGTDPKAVIQALDAADIEARYLWKPMHLQPVFESNRSFVNGASQALFETGVTLPSGSALSDSDVDRVIEVLVGVLAGKA